MTVKELIEKLQKFDPLMTVCVEASGPADLDVASDGDFVYIGTDAALEELGLVDPDPLAEDYPGQRVDGPEDAESKDSIEEVCEHGYPRGVTCRGCDPDGQ